MAKQMNISLGGGLSASAPVYGPDGTQIATVKAELEYDDEPSRLRAIFYPRSRSPSVKLTLSYEKAE